MSITVALYALGAAAVLVNAPRVKRRIELSRAKHRSLAGHSKWSKRIAGLIPSYQYADDEFFQSDDAPADVVEMRRAGLATLGTALRGAHPQSLELTARARETISDLQFTGRYRVPFQYSPVVRERLPIGAFVRASEGIEIEDLDGQRLLDVTGSYGVNVFGYDFYKSCIDEGARRAQALGPVLGAYHPAVADVARRLRAVSGLDEVSFHMSGTEAVMQAVRLARYHTGRKYLVRFCGAYHGWWEDVQPGIGNPLPPRETYTLSDLSERTLQVLRTRDDIACVLVNPLQALHPNANAPGDSALVDSSRRAQFDRPAYTRWLQRLREVCTERGIVLILDEVFVGFRLAPGGAQEYFGVRADLVTYGKTLGGGLPVGVVCGKADLMRRFDPVRPADVCFARGTFNAHPYVICAMQAFLERLESPSVLALYQGLEERWNGCAQRLNAMLEQADVPVRVANLSTIWTVCYTRPCRYNWMLQYYLRAEGIALSWVGTGRLIFSLNWTDADFERFAQRFVRAAARMAADGWWWENPALDDRGIRRRILREMIRRRLGGRPGGAQAPEPESGAAAAARVARSPQDGTVA